MTWDINWAGLQLCTSVRIDGFLSKRKLQSRNWANDVSSSHHECVPETRIVMNRTLSTVHDLKPELEILVKWSIQWINQSLIVMRKSAFNDSWSLPNDLCATERPSSRSRGNLAPSRILRLFNSLTSQHDSCFSLPYPPVRRVLHKHPVVGSAKCVRQRHRVSAVYLQLHPWTAM